MLQVFSRLFNGLIKQKEAYLIRLKKGTRTFVSTVPQTTFLIKDVKTSFTEELLMEVISLSLEHPRLVG